jgi:hypothetical protein
MGHEPDRRSLAGRAPGSTARRALIAFEDLTRPAERAYGFYLIKVAVAGQSRVIRASHPTAKRLARRRTQYGDAELSFLGAIDTPALD